MISSRKTSRNIPDRARAPLGRPGARSAVTATGGAEGNIRRSVMTASHPLTDVQENSRLFEYESSVKEAFDGIVPALKKISALQHEGDFVNKAQRIAVSQLGFEL